MSEKPRPSLADVLFVLAGSHEAIARATRLEMRALHGEDVSTELGIESKEAELRAGLYREYSGAGDFGTLISSGILLEEIAAERRTRCVYGNPLWTHFNLPPRPVWPTDTAIAAAKLIAQHAGEPRVAPESILASKQTAKRAYRRAAKRMHPDIGGDTRTMQQLTAAHECVQRTVVR